jgi:hypothetical protein
MITFGVLISCLIILISSDFQKNDKFKILRLKGEIAINEKTIKVGDEYPISDIENLTINTNDESGFIVVCYNNCTRNKIILEKTIDYAGIEEKRKLLETTTFKTRGEELSSFPELVNYFEQKPIIVLGDNKLTVAESVLGFPKQGSYLDLYYLNNGNEIIHKIPYEEYSFFLQASMFEKSNMNEEIVGPITLTMVDLKSSKENLITEEFYVALIDTTIIKKSIIEMSRLKFTKREIAESIYDLLSVEFPRYFTDLNSVIQFVENQ